MLCRLSLALLLTVSASAQVIVLAEGTVNSLRIATVPESSPNAPDTVVLQNAELLPVEITGRTVGREHGPSNSRRLSRNGIERVELPDGGRLLRYRRDGGQHWGFLHIAPDGQATVVLEHAGVGAGLSDPFFDQIGVADDGRHAVVSLLAGGAHTVKLDGTLYASTGRPDRLALPATQTVAPTSMMVGPTHFFCSAGSSGVDRLFRCALADGAVPVDLTPPTTALDRLQEEMVMSGDGQHVVFLHGPQRQQRLWHATTTGAAAVLPPPPSKYEEPNYLPFGVGEPAMSLNEDGSRLFFVDSSVRDELFLLDVQGALPALQITDDPIFQPYIGVHILPKFDGTRLLIAIGDIGRMDWFRADLAASGNTVANLTGTGSQQQPYPAGALSPIAGADTGSSLLLVEQTAAGMDLRRMDTASGTSAIVQSDAALSIATGSSFGPAADVTVHGVGGDRLYRGLTATPFATTPAGVLMTAPVQGPLLSGTQVHLLIPWGIPVFYFAGGGVIAGQIEYGLKQIVMTESGGVLLNGGTLRYFGIGTSVVLQRPPTPLRLVLSGAGG
ncbi:MAG: hypothetical protein KDC98_12385 [Planctomycetes bacterium]|nr:hypothetical protein [Planctomycetota bacterium]